MNEDHRPGNKGYVASNDIYWRYHIPEKNIVDKPPPLNVKLQLLTRGGVQVEGRWRDNAGFLAWCPCVKRNKAFEREHGITDY